MNRWGIGRDRVGLRDARGILVAVRFADPSPRGVRLRWLAASLVFGLVLVHSLDAADKSTAPTSPAEDPVIVLELPHPALIVDRVTDARIQRALNLLPPYRKFLQGDQFRQLKGVVSLISAQLGMSWDRAIRELAGGGILVRVLAEKGGQPRIQAVMTARDPKLLERLNEVFLRMARQDAKAKKKPDPVRTSDYHGVVVHSLGEGEKRLAYAVIEGRLVLASSIKDLERLIDRPATDGGATGEPILAADRNGSPATLLRGHVDMPRLKALDPKKFELPAKPNPGIVFFFGSWYEALKRARSIDATIRWSESEFSASLDLALPKDARPASVKGFVPGPGERPLPPLRPAGTIASLSLWRDWATIWESRADLLPPETVQGLAQFDTLAGQFFGGREFGADVLGGFAPHWRLVVAQQDYGQLKPAPDQKLPAFAIVAELDDSQEDFASRLRIAFQSLVAISNVDSAQKKAAVLELGSQEVDGVSIATTRYVVPRKGAAASGPGAQRYNYSPSAAQVGRYFILSSSVGLARSLVQELKSGKVAEPADSEGPATFTVDADGPELASLLEQNRSRMVMQTMLGGGETREDAEERVGMILSLVRYLGHGHLRIVDAPDRTRADLKLDLSR